MGFDPPGTYRNDTDYALGRYLLNTEADKEGRSLAAGHSLRDPEEDHRGMHQACLVGVGVKQKAQGISICPKKADG
jgi:hypothetical protein